MNFRLVVIGCALAALAFLGSKLYRQYLEETRIRAENDKCDEKLDEKIDELLQRTAK